MTIVAYKGISMTINYKLYKGYINDYKLISYIFSASKGKCAIDLYNYQHQSPLILAIARGLTAISEDLVEHGADVNSTDGDGDSCLHIAVMRHRRGLDVPDSDTLKKVFFAQNTYD